MNVLVVDDSKVMRMKLKGLIGSSGISGMAILEACHGREALAAFDSAAIDLVFTDINMPEMDGRQFLQALAARALPNPPYRVVCTTETPQGLKEELSGYGVNLYIEKPFNPDAVKQVLAMVAAKQGAAAT